MTVAADVAALAAKGDTFFLVWAGCMVFFMQCGFAVLEAGTVRAKNTKNILIKNLLDACLGGVMWYLVGFGLAFGDDTDNAFFGSGAGVSYAIHPTDWSASYSSEGNDWAFWFFQYTFAAAAATIISGGVAERCTLTGYGIYSVVITSFIYPVVVHMFWDSEGVISAFNGSTGSPPILGGCIDFAGSGVVHLTGGIGALAGAFFLGPRIGRFDVDGKPVPMPGHSAVLQVLGTFILWLGWYGFNGGSTLSVFGLGTAYARDLARVCVTTTLGACAGALSTFFCSYLLTHVWDIAAVSNGILVGLVSVTAGCVVIDPWAALVIGMIGGLLYTGASKLLLRLRIDDPLDAFAVHGCSGTWGVLAVGIFCRPEYSYNLLGKHGFVYPGASPDLIGVQIVALLIIWLWVGVTATAMFGVLKVAGILRVPVEIEEMGMDVSKHGGEAYPEQSKAA